MTHLKKIKAIRYQNGKHKEIDEETVTDEFTNLIIDQLPPRKFSTYPENLEDFAIGYTLVEGLIRNIKDIQNINIEGQNVFIKTKLNNKIQGKENGIIRNNTGENMCCSCMNLLNGGSVLSDSGGGWRSNNTQVQPVKSNLKINSTDIIKNMKRLTDKAIIWQKTASVHVAQLVYGEEYIIREDVSRHVAVDKVIGAAAKRKYDLSQSYILYSGRMPADMVIKVVRVGIPILISNAAPAGSGYEIAKNGNITLIGFVRGDRFNLYTSPERVNLDK